MKRNSVLCAAHTRFLPWQRLTALIFCGALAASLAGCGATPAASSDAGTGGEGPTPAAAAQYQPLPGVDAAASGTLTIAIPYETDKALNTVANDFMARYPGVRVVLQYIEDYNTNAVKLFQENELDILLQKDQKYVAYTAKNEATGEAEPTGLTTDDYYYDFAADPELKFATTTPDITDNYRHLRKLDDGSELSYQYSYPLGGETRGVFVNKTLLAEHGLAVPTNYSEFLHCCETLKQAGLIPIQGSPASAAYGLGVAAAANAVVHDEAALQALAKAQPGSGEPVHPTLDKLYELAVHRYFDYKAVEETGWFKESDEVVQCENFLGLKTDETTFEVSKAEDSSVAAAFFPYISSTETVIRNLIDEYELDTEVVFIPAPLNDDGGSPVYITPYYGLCVNKNSEQLLWAREFVNFIFFEENMKKYAEAASIIPNVGDAMQLVAQKYGVDPARDVALCGQILFSDSYNGFKPLGNAVTVTLKCNAQKYMVDLAEGEDGTPGWQTDENGQRYLLMGNGETKVAEQYVGAKDDTVPGYAFCTKDYFYQELETEIAAYRTA